MLNNIITRSLVASFLIAAPLSLAAQTASARLESGAVEFIAVEDCEENVGAALRLWIERGRLWSPDLGRFIDDADPDLLPQPHPTYEIGPSATGLELWLRFERGGMGADVEVFDEEAEEWTYYDTIAVDGNLGRIVLPVDASFKLELLAGGMSEEIYEYPYEDEGPDGYPPTNKFAVLKPVKDCTD